MERTKEEAEKAERERLKAPPLAALVWPEGLSGKSVDDARGHVPAVDDPRIEKGSTLRAVLRLGSSGDLAANESGVVFRAPQMGKNLSPGVCSTGRAGGDRQTVEVLGVLDILSFRGPTQCRPNTVLNCWGCPSMQTKLRSMSAHSTHSSLKVAQQGEDNIQEEVGGTFWLAEPPDSGLTSRWSLVC